MMKIVVFAVVLLLTGALVFGAIALVYSVSERKERRRKGESYPGLMKWFEYNRFHEDKK